MVAWSDVLGRPIYKCISTLNGVKVLLAACIGFAPLRGWFLLLFKRYCIATTVLLASGWRMCFEVAGGVRAERGFPPPDSIATVPHVHTLDANDQSYREGARAELQLLPSSHPISSCCMIVIVSNGLLV